MTKPKTPQEIAAERERVCKLTQLLGKHRWDCEWCSLEHDSHLKAVDDDEAYDAPARSWGDL